MSNKPFNSSVVFFDSTPLSSSEKESSGNFLEAIKARSIMELSSLLAEMLDGADDSLYDLSDKSSTDKEQGRYFESMRELRIKRKGIKNIFGNELQNQFHTLTQDSAYGGRITQSSPSLESFTLVQDDELEENLALDAMVHKTRKKNQLALVQLTARLNAILPLANIEVSNNPIEPRKIMDAFFEASKSLSLDIKAKLVVFKLFERGVANNLDYVYSELNQWLIGKGVLPDLPDMPLIRKRTNKAKEKNADGSTTDGSTSDDNQSNSEVGNEVLKALRELLSFQKKALGNPSATPSVNSEQLVHALNSMQVETISNNLQLTDLRSQIGGLLPITGPVSNQNIGQTNDDVIDIISMLFEFILDDDNLPSEFKAVLGRLQIPLLKVAIIDPSFFSAAAHPARTLLNKMAQSGIGWSSETRGLGLMEKVEQIVSRISTDFKDDPTLFETLLQEFNEYIDQFKQRAALVERRTREAEEGRATTESAKQKIDIFLAKLSEVGILPDIVNKLLNEAWHNVMLLTLLKHGDTSEKWKGAVKTAENLIYTLNPPQNDAQRRRLMGLLGVVVRSLRDGLNEIAYGEFESAHLFQELEQLHLRVLKGEQVVLEPEVRTLDVEILDEVLPASNSIVQTADVSIVESKNDLVERTLSIDEEIACAEREIEQLDALNAGDLDTLLEIEIDKDFMPDFAEFDIAELESTELESTELENAEFESAEFESATAGVTVSVCEHIEKPVMDPELFSIIDDVFEDTEFTDDVGFSQAPVPEEVCSEKSNKWGMSDNKDNIEGRAHGAHLPEIKSVSDNCEQLLNQVDTFQVNNWFELTLKHSEQPVRSKLAAIIPTIGKYIFVNRTGIKVADFLRGELASALQCGNIKMLNDGALFDRALESIVSNLRAQKQRQDIGF